MVHTTGKRTQNTTKSHNMTVKDGGVSGFHILTWSCFLQRHGSRTLLLAGAVPYVLWMASNTVLHLLHGIWRDVLMLPMSTLLGIGAALLWTSQGVFTSLCAMNFAANALGGFQGHIYGAQVSSRTC
jgi:hypothetical protein